MTPEEQRIAIAEACGWSDIKQGPYDGQPFGRQLSHQLLPLPDYLEDLNAMHEAEASLTPDQGGDFESILEDICQRALISEDSGHWLRFKVTHATAAQRAEAFLRATGRWKNP